MGVVDDLHVVILSRELYAGISILTSRADTYSACSPVFKLTQTGQPGVFHETAAFNAMLTDGTCPNNLLIMHAGDTITVHWFTTSAADGFHVTVADLTTGGSGTIVLNSKSFRLATQIAHRGPALRS